MQLRDRRGRYIFCQIFVIEFIGRGLYLSRYYINKCNTGLLKGFGLRRVHTCTQMEKSTMKRMVIPSESLDSAMKTHRTPSTV